MRRPISLPRAELVLAAFIGLGIALRLYHFAARRSLWIDEARLALNLGGRSWAELAGPLWYDQTAPLFFLWATKAVFGVYPGELSLRALPLLASLISLGLAAHLGWKLVSPRAAVLLVAIIALSPSLVYFSNEFKPYATDMFVTCLLLALTIRAASHPGTEPLVLVAVAGILAPWASTPSPLVLFGCAIALVSAPGIRSRYPAAALLVCGAWLISVLACYAVVLRPAASNPYLADFWSYRMLNPGPGFIERVWEAWKEVTAGTIAGLTAVRGSAEVEKTVLAVTALAGSVVGAVGLVRNRPSFIAAGVIVPLIMTLVAAIAGVYPIALRISLFAAPLWLITFVGGVDTILRSLGAPRLGWIIVAVALLIQPLRRGLVAAAHPLAWEHVRPAISEVQVARRAGEPVYVSAGALPAWAFYTTDWDSVDRARLEVYARAGSSGGPSFENAASVGGEEMVVQHCAAPGECLTELLGRSAGRQWRWGIGFTRERPDERWAESEAARLRGAGAPTAWILSAHDFGLRTELTDAISRAGGSVDVVFDASDVLAARVGFCSEGAECVRAAQR